jgi:hypothetical protein
MSDLSPKLREKIVQIHCFVPEFWSQDRSVLAILFWRQFTIPFGPHIKSGERTQQ